MHIKALKTFIYRMNERGDTRTIPQGWEGHIPDAAAQENAESLLDLSPAAETVAEPVAEPPRSFTGDEVLAELVDILRNEEFSADEIGRDGIVNVNALKARINDRLGVSLKITAADRNKAVELLQAEGAEALEKSGDEPAIDGDESDGASDPDLLG